MDCCLVIVLVSTFQSVKGFVDNIGCCGQRLHDICQVSLNL